MGFITVFLRLLTAPFRAIARIFRGPSLQTVEKSGAGRIAKDAGDGVRFEDEAAAVVDGRSLFFKRLARPTLVERTAADLTLEEAKEYAAEAQKFYTYPFPLFTRADFFLRKSNRITSTMFLAETRGRRTRISSASWTVSARS